MSDLLKLMKSKLKKDNKNVRQKKNCWDAL